MYDNLGNLYICEIFTWFDQINTGIQPTLTNRKSQYIEGMTGRLMSMSEASFLIQNYHVQVFLQRKSPKP
jgi:hypothetical protein